MIVTIIIASINGSTRDIPNTCSFRSIIRFAIETRTKYKKKTEQGKHETAIRFFENEQEREREKRTQTKHYANIT